MLQLGFMPESSKLSNASRFESLGAPTSDCSTLHQVLRACQTPPHAAGTPLTTERR